MATRLSGHRRTVLVDARDAEPIDRSGRLWTELPFIVAASAPLIVLIVVATVTSDQAIAVAMRDVTATAKIGPLTGIMSSLGAFLWFGTLALCLFTAIVAPVPSDIEPRRFLLWTTALTAYLWFDDFFMFHEALGPSLGMRERYGVALGGAILVTFCFRFRRTIMGEGGMILRVALALLACSVVADAVLSKVWSNIDARTILIEDGLKWLGICAWARFYADCCAKLFRLNR